MKKKNPLNVIVEQLPISDHKNCCWHGRYKEGQEFSNDQILPEDACPWLYHTVYPYFLGLYYGARFDWNEHGDCNVCCPAANGVDVLVKIRDNDGTFDPRISSKMKYVIFAEIIKVGDCPLGHKVGQRIVFPTSMVQHYMCPAAFHNIFPLMKLKPPSCIDLDNLRCPDWNDVVSFKLPSEGTE